jgi:hypothetical protein
MRGALGSWQRCSATALDPREETARALRVCSWGSGVGPAALGRDRLPFLRVLVRSSPPPLLSRGVRLSAVGAGLAGSRAGWAAVPVEAHDGGVVFELAAGAFEDGFDEMLYRLSRVHTRPLGD